MDKADASLEGQLNNIALRSDFEGLGGYEQVGRILRKLVVEGLIMKIGHGLDAKAEVSTLTGKILTLLSLPALAREALQCLKIETAPSTLERDHNAGRSAQVPTGRLIAIKSHTKRKIGYDGVFVSYERMC